MRAILEFDFDKDGDHEAHMLCVNARNMHSALVEICEYFRKINKHGVLDDLQAENKAYEVAERINEKCYEIIDDNKVEL